MVLEMIFMSVRTKEFRFAVSDNIELWVHNFQRKRFYDFCFSVGFGNSVLLFRMVVKRKFKGGDS